MWSPTWKSGCWWYLSAEFFWISWLCSIFYWTVFYMSSIFFIILWVSSWLTCLSWGRVLSMGYQLKEVQGSYPQSIRKGEVRVVSLGSAAVAKSIMGNNSDQLSWWWLINGCIQIAICWLTISVCPSVCAWCMVDNFNWIPRILQNSFQKSEINWGPLSEIMVVSTPWCWYICSTNNQAILAASVIL